MLVGRVIHDEIDEYAHSALFAGPCEFDKVAEGAVSRINAVVIGYIIAIVFAGRGLKRHQPQGRNSKSLQVVQTTHQALEVPYTVTICIQISSNR